MTHSIAYQQHQIKYYIEGNGDILLFLHGWPTNAKLWKAQMESLKHRYQVVAIDWLGFGESDKPVEHKYTFTKKKEILDVLLSEILKDDEKVNIIAHDIGGPPAILWASENQERVKRLILLNTVIFPFSTLLDKISHFGFGIPILKNFLVSQPGLKYVMTTIAKNRDGHVKSRMKEILGAYENVDNEIKLKTILEPLQAGKKKEFLVLAEKFKLLTINKYLIIAKGDPLCFAHIKKLSADNPEVPTYFIDDCGHYISIEKPLELNNIITEILENGEN